MAVLRASKILHDSRFMLVAVESVDFQRGKMGKACQLYGVIEPVAVIVCDMKAIYALDMTGNPIAVDRLIEAVPGLDAVLAPAVDT